MGFDADTDKCGVAFLDTKTGVYSAKVIDYNTLILDKMPNLLSKIKASELIIYIEMPTIQTAMGVNRSKTGIAKAEGIYNSGQCRNIARLFQQYCQKNDIQTVIVKSEKRVRCDKKDLKNLNLKALMLKAMSFKKQGRFLSKLEYYKVTKLFPALNFVNCEITDAILLLLPDMPFLINKLD